MLYEVVYCTYFSFLNSCMMFDHMFSIQIKKLSFYRVGPLSTVDNITQEWVY